MSLITKPASLYFQTFFFFSPVINPNKPPLHVIDGDQGVTCVTLHYYSST